MFREGKAEEASLSTYTFFQLGKVHRKRQHREKNSPQNMIHRIVSLLENMSLHDMERPRFSRTRDPLDNGCNSLWQVLPGNSCFPSMGTLSSSPLDTRCKPSGRVQRRNHRDKESIPFLASSRILPHTGCRIQLMAQNNVQAHIRAERRKHSDIGNLMGSRDIHRCQSTNTTRDRRVLFRFLRCNGGPQDTMNN